MNLIISNPNNKYYKLAIKKEFAIGDIDKNLLPDYSNCWDLHPKILKYHNEDFIEIKDDTEFGWYDFLYKNFPPVNIALSLGGGTGRHEIAMLKAGFVKKWTAVDLVVNKGEIFHYGGGKVNSLHGDLNFIELPENKYHLIFCHGFLHHIVNLEHLVYQINKALTSDGIFVVTEYIGEKKWQFSERKKRFIKEKLEKKYNNIYDGNILKSRSIIQMNRGRPLESIRSDEVFSVLHSTFRESIVLEYRGSYIIYPTINLLNKDFKFFLKKENLVNNFMDYLVSIEKNINKKLFMPTLLIAVYKKSEKSRIINTDLWTKKEIKKNLYAPKRLRDYIPNNFKDKIPKKLKDNLKKLF